jgi:hypothetical protein
MSAELIELYSRWFDKCVSLFLSYPLSIPYHRKPNKKSIRKDVDLKSSIAFGTLVKQICLNLNVTGNATSTSTPSSTPSPFQGAASLPQSSIGLVSALIAAFVFTLWRKDIVLWVRSVVVRGSWGGIVYRRIEI